MDPFDGPNQSARRSREPEARLIHVGSKLHVALLEMQTDLGFSPGNLSWVFNACVVAFGGLLLLGGKLSDLIGARRIFAAGWAILLVGSLVAGLARRRRGRAVRQGRSGYWCGGGAMIRTCGWSSAW